MTTNNQPIASSQHQTFHFPLVSGAEKMWIVHRDITGEFYIWDGSAPRMNHNAVVDNAATVHQPDIDPEAGPVAW